MLLRSQREGFTVKGCLGNDVIEIHSIGCCRRRERFDHVVIAEDCLYSGIDTVLIEGTSTDSLFIQEALNGCPPPFGWLLLEKVLPARSVGIVGSQIGPYVQVSPATPIAFEVPQEQPVEKPN